MHYEFILQQFLHCFEGFASSQVAQSSDELNRDVLMITHAHLDGSQDSDLLSRNEMQILHRGSFTDGSKRILVLVELL